MCTISSNIGTTLIVSILILNDGVFILIGHFGVAAQFLEHGVNKHKFQILYVNFLG